MDSDQAAARLEGRDGCPSSCRRTRLNIVCCAWQHHSRLTADAAQAGPVEQHVVNISLGFGDLRNAAVAHASGSRVVGGERQVVVTEAIELLAQILGPAAQIALD